MAEQEQSDGAKAATQGAGGRGERAPGAQPAQTDHQERAPRRSRGATSRRSTRRDLDTAVALWADGGRDNVRGQVDALAPEGVRAFLGELLDAVPDLDFEIVSTTAQDERCAVQWRLQRHVRRARLAQRHRADRRPPRRSRGSTCSPSRTG